MPSPRSSSGQFSDSPRNRLAALLVSCLGALTSVVLFALSNTGSSNSATRWVVGAGIAVVVVAVGAEALFGRRAGPNGSPHPIAAIASTLPLFVPLAALAAFPGNTSGSGSPGGSSVLAYVAIGFWLLVLLFLIAGTDMLNWRPVSNPVAQTGAGRVATRSCANHFRATAVAGPGRCFRQMPHPSGVAS
ncbi:MAG: hypothetical protein H6512_14105 [Acidimicrobiia bacterium]|nr:hypothetical protein [Acidimicrobiia bacterium]